MWKIFEIFKKKQTPEPAPKYQLQRQIRHGWVDVDAIDKKGTYRKLQFNANGTVSLVETIRHDAVQV